MFGKPGTEMPRWACAPPAQRSCSVAPPAPVISIGNMKSFVRNPVDQMMQSTSCLAPSAVRSASDSTRTIGWVTSSTLTRCSAGRK